MNQYPIWITINSCAYKSDKSYGVKSDGLQVVNVGTSSRNSHHFCEIQLSHREHPDGSREYWLRVDGKLIKSATLAKKADSLVFSDLD